jgi:hypothetical protein
MSARIIAGELDWSNSELTIESGCQPRHQAQLSVRVLSNSRRTCAQVCKSHFHKVYHTTNVHDILPTPIFK